MIKILINGALGRMGRTITEVALRDKDVKIVGLVDLIEEKKVYSDLPPIVKDINKYIELCDVVIDFSSPEGTQQVLNAAEKNKKSVVIGTTGHSEQQLYNINSTSAKIPIVFSPNMSLGVNLLFKLVEIVTNVLKDKEYDIEIFEAHHNKKKDAPSGTAKKIMEIIKKIKPDIEFIFGREGICERKKNEVGVFAIRCGDIVGEHSIIYATQGEKIELRHNATSRETFAKGAILASKWVVSKTPGLYNMFDVLELKEIKW